MIINLRQRGDTIIEVLLAVTVFSMVAVSTMVIMNRGLSVVQQSLEITLVRQQIDSQAEMLRYIHDQDKTAWTNLSNSFAVDPSTVTANEGGLGASSCPSSFGSREFALTASGSNITPISGSSFQRPFAYAKVDSNKSYGISIKLVKPGAGKESNKYDAYIKACWVPVGSNMPTTLGTIVRLYDAGR